MAQRAVSTKPQEGDIFHPPGIPEGFKKAVGVVQVAMGKLGFLHRKLANVLLCNAYEGLGEGKLHFAIQVSSLAELAGFDSRDYQGIYDHCRDLLETTVEFIDFDDRASGKRKPRRRRGATSLISDFAVTEGGLITYSYSREMAKKLYEPEQYIWMALAVQKRFSSKYELNLFENCIRYVQVGSTGFKDVEDWRALLGATEPLYDEFKYFNKKVLKEASLGVKEKAGLIVEPEFEREKRKVARIRFLVSENPQGSLFDHAAHSRMRQMPVYKTAQSMGLKEVEIFYWIEKKGEAYVEDAVAYAQAQKAEKPAAYLVTTLKQGYGQQTPEERQKKIDAAERAEAFRVDQEAKVAAQREEEELAERFRVHQAARTSEILAELSAEEREVVREAVSSDIAIPAVAQQWDAIERDLDRIDELKPMPKGIMLNRLNSFVLERWGRAGDTDIAAFRELSR